MLLRVLVRFRQLHAHPFAEELPSPVATGSPPRMAGRQLRTPHRGDDRAFGAFAFGRGIRDDGIANVASGVARPGAVAPPAAHAYRHPAAPRTPRWTVGDRSACCGVRERCRGPDRAECLPGVAVVAIARGSAPAIRYQSPRSGSTSPQLARMHRAARRAAARIAIAQRTLALRRGRVHRMLQHAVASIAGWLPPGADSSVSPNT